LCSSLGVSVTAGVLSPITVACGRRRRGRVFIELRAAATTTMMAINSTAKAASVLPCGLASQSGRPLSLLEAAEAEAAAALDSEPDTALEAPEAAASDAAVGAVS